MYQSKWRITLSSKGYTFVEALFQVVVFMLFAQFIAYFFIWQGQFQSTFLSTEEINWDMFIHDLERSFTDVTEISVVENEIVLQNKHDEKTIVINIINDVIRMRKDNSGNIPLLIGIKNAQFHYAGNILTISVEFLNGMQKERNIVVQTVTE